MPPISSSVPPGPRPAAPTLIWSAGGVTYRLEGLPALAEATAVASHLT